MIIGVDLLVDGGYTIRRRTTATTQTATTTIPERMRQRPHRPLTLSVEDVPTPPMASDEVLVKVAAVGVCGLDTHYYRHGRIGDFVVTAPPDPRPRVVRSNRRGGRGRAGDANRRAGGHRAAEELPGSAVSAAPATTTSAKTWSFTPRRRSTVRS